MRRLRPHSDGVIVDPSYRRNEHFLRRDPYEFVPVDHGVFRDTRGMGDHHRDVLHEFANQEFPTGPLKAIALIVCLFFVARMVTCDCPVEDEILIDGVEKSCFEDYTRLDCGKDKTPSDYRTRKECERLKDCLEDPKTHFFKSRKSAIDEFFEEMS